MKYIKRLKSDILRKISPIYCILIAFKRSAYEDSDILIKIGYIYGILEKFPIQIELFHPIYSWGIFTHLVEHN